MQKALIFIFALMTSTALAQPPLQDRVKVTKGIASIYRTDAPFANIVTGDPTVVDVRALTDRSILIEGKHIGSTNLIFLDQNKFPTSEVVVSVGEQGPGYTRIHNKAKLNSFTSFNCWETGCEFVGENTVAEPAPLPRGYLNSTYINAPAGPLPAGQQ